MGGAVRFRWPGQRYDRLTRESIAIALGLTAAASMAISIPVVTIFRASESANPLLTQRPDEIVAFVQPVVPRPMRSVRVDAASRQRAAKTTDEPIERPLTRDTSSFTPAVAPPVIAEITPGNRSTDAARGSERVGPFAVPERLSWTKTLSEAARDSLDKLTARLVAEAFRKPHVPTTAQRDSAARENDRLAMVARDEHRPLAVPLGGARVPFTFLSSGKSREERHRDSVVHADNLQRLARLAERARAKHDSILAASALAGSPFRNHGAADSLKRRPDQQPNDD